MKKRYVLTGSCCSGKTTLINKLQSLGFQVLPETARQILEKRKHITPDKKENQIRQELIYQAQLYQENSHSSGLTFLDRSLIDVLAYSKLLTGKKYQPSENLENRYSKVFLLDYFPFQKDSVRIETPEMQKQIHQMIKQEYISQRYNLITIPKLPLEERLSFILNQVKGGE